MASRFVPRSIHDPARHHYQRLLINVKSSAVQAHLSIRPFDRRSRVGLWRPARRPGARGTPIGSLDTMIAAHALLVTNKHP
jgi:predicted nucleic acid-binding protein